MLKISFEVTIYKNFKISDTTPNSVSTTFSDPHAHNVWLIMNNW